MKNIVVFLAIIATFWTTAKAVSDSNDRSPPPSSQTRHRTVDQADGMNMYDDEDLDDVSVEELKKELAEFIHSQETNEDYDADTKTGFVQGNEDIDDNNDAEAIKANMEEVEEKDEGDDGKGQEANEEDEDGGKPAAITEIDDDDAEATSNLKLPDPKNNDKAQATWYRCRCSGWKRAYYKQVKYKNYYYRLYRKYAKYYSKYYRYYVNYYRHYHSCNKQRSKCKSQNYHLKRGYRKIIKSHSNLIRACRGKK